MKNTKKSVAVVGAGTLGLVTAYYLIKEGYKVTVFERNPRIGGMAEGFNLASGKRADKFYHYFCKGDKEVFKLIKELNKTEKLHFEKIRTSLTYSRKATKEIKTVEFNDLIDLLAIKDLSATAKIRFMLHMAYLRFFTPLKHDRVTAVKNYPALEGNEAFIFFFKYLLQKKFYKYTNSISALFLDYRIKRVLQCKSLFKGTEYGFYEGGSSSLLDDLYKTLVENGVEFNLYSDVKKIRTVNRKNRVKVLFKNTITGSSQEQFFDDCAVTVPAPYLNSILDDLHANEKRLFSHINNVGCVCVVIELEKPFSPYFWNNTKITGGISGIIDFSSIKTLDGNVIYIPQYMPHLQGLWDLPNKSFTEYVLKKISKFIEPDNRIISTHCFRYEYAQPVFDKRFFRKIRTMKTSLDGVYWADTSFSYPNDRCMNECIKIARRLTDTIISHDNS